MRFTTTCCADDGCVIVQIVMASPPDPDAPPPPQAARLVAATRAAAAVASACLEPGLLCMFLPCLPGLKDRGLRAEVCGAGSAGPDRRRLGPGSGPSVGQANSRLRAPSMQARRNNSRTRCGHASYTSRWRVTAL